MRGEMLSKVSATLVVIALTAACGSGYAADLEPAPMYKAPVVPVYTWTGIYFGANGGYAFGLSTPMALYTDSFSAFNFTTNGWLGGLTAGAQLQVGHTVMGFEGDIDWANLTGKSTGTINFNGAPIGTATLSSSVSGLGTLRSRVGYAFDNWLVFGTAGLAITDERSNLTGPIGFVCGTGTPSSPPCSSLTNLHPGVALGGGVEYGFTQNLSAKVEYLWIGAGALNTLQENVVRAGLNFRFGM
jgi:outer membrane immunogenic protein